VWEFLTEVLRVGGLQSIAAIALAAFNWLQWKQNRSLQREKDVLQDKRVEEAKAVTDRVLEVKHDFDTMVAKLSAVVDAVLESRGRR